MKILPDQIKHTPAGFPLGNGFSIKINTRADEDADTPWENSDGHGSVSDWTVRRKRAGEITLATDGQHRRFYDFAGAIATAKRDGWGLHADKLAELEKQIGRKASPKEIRAEAVRLDFEFLRGWCADEWHYIGVIVQLIDAEGKEVAQDSIWCVESFGNYWRELGAEMASALMEEHEAETAERTHWEERDVQTT